MSGPSNPDGASLRTSAMSSFSAAAVLLGSLLFLGACGSGDEKPAAADGPTVTTKLLAYEPETLEVKAGTTVTWSVSDSIAHTVTTGTFELGGNGLRTAQNPDGRIDKPISAGKDVSYTFDEPGTYTYYCSIHKGMTGVVEVTK